MTGLTPAYSAANSGSYTNTDLLTAFDNASFRILLSQGQTGSSNGTDPSYNNAWGHGYIFFVFTA